MKIVHAEARVLAEDHIKETPGATMVRRLDQLDSGAKEGVRRKLNAKNLV